MAKRISPCERLHAQIDEVFAGGGDLAGALEEVARLGAQLLLQAAIEGEVAAFLGRERYERVTSWKDIRAGMRNGYCPTTVKTTSGPVTVQRPKLRGTTERFASQLARIVPAGGEPVVVSGAGHFLQEDRGEWIGETVAAWLPASEVTRSPAGARRARA